MWEEPLFWGWVPRPVGMVPALSPLSRVPGLCAVGLGLGRAGRWWRGRVLRVFEALLGHGTA